MTRHPTRRYSVNGRGAIGSLDPGEAWSVLPGQLYPSCPERALCFDGLTWLAGSALA